MGNTYKDKEKKLAIPVLKKKKDKREEQEEEDDIDINFFKPTEEEESNWREYLNQGEDDVFLDD